MSTDIMNGGMRANILKIAQDSGTVLSEEDEKFMNKRLSLPKGVWIPLDDNGEPITQEEANKNLLNEFNKYKPCHK